MRPQLRLVPTDNTQGRVLHDAAAERDDERSTRPQRRRPGPSEPDVVLRRLQPAVVDAGSATSPGRRRRRTPASRQTLRREVARTTGRLQRRRRSSSSAHPAPVQRHQRADDGRARSADHRLEHRHQHLERDDVQPARDDLHGRASTTRTAACSTGPSARARSSNVTVGYLGYGGHSAGGDYYHGIAPHVRGRRTSTTSTCRRTCSSRSGYADNNVQQLERAERLQPLQRQRATSRSSSTWKGQHSFKARRAARAVRQRRQQRPAVPERHAHLERARRTTLGSQQVRGTYGYYAVRRQYTTGNVHSNNIGLFVQDQWTVSPKLTINYGLRDRPDEHPVVPRGEPGHQVRLRRQDRAARRLRLRPEGRRQAGRRYGSWGVFYDIEKLEMPLGSFGAQHWISYYWTLDDYNWPAIDCDGTPTSNCPGTFIEQVDLRHVSNGTGADNLVDPNLKPYKSEELTFGARSPARRGRSSVGTRYTHKWIDEGDRGRRRAGAGRRRGLLHRQPG